MEAITDMMMEMFTTVQNAGWEPPYCFAILGANGSILAGQMAGNDQDALEVRFITEHIEGGGLATPVNILITNAQGDGVRFVYPRPAAQKRGH